MWISWLGGENLCKGNYFFNFFLEEFWGGSMWCQYFYLTVCVPFGSSPEKLANMWLVSFFVGKATYSDSNQCATGVCICVIGSCFQLLLAVLNMIILRLPGNKSWLYCTQVTFV